MLIHCIKKDNKLIYNNTFSYTFVYIYLHICTFYVDYIVDFHVKIGQKDILLWIYNQVYILYIKCLWKLLLKDILVTVVFT